MRFDNPHTRALWAASRLQVWPQRYRFIAFDQGDLARLLPLLSEISAPGTYLSLIRDGFETALIVEQSNAERVENRLGAAIRRHGPLACITFDVPLDIAVSGFLRPAIDCLAERGISVVVQCALVYDHILVHEDDIGPACEALSGLIEQARSA